MYDLVAESRKESEKYFVGTGFCRDNRDMTVIKGFLLYLFQICSEVWRFHI